MINNVILNPHNSGQPTEINSNDALQLLKEYISILSDSNQLNQLNQLGGNLKPKTKTKEKIKSPKSKTKTKTKEKIKLPKNKTKRTTTSYTGTQT